MLWAMLLPLPILGQALGSNCFPIWQGFSHQWGYNHRINRLGDWVENVSEGDSCTIKGTHSAASGSGADVLDFTQYLTTVHSDLVETRSGVVTFSLSGKEGEYVAEIQTGEAQFLAASDSTTAYEVLLNGFDLCTANGAKADKIQSLDMAIDSVWRERGSQIVHFRIKAALKFSCSSPECEPLNQIVDYRLRLFWTAVGGQGFASVRSTFGSGRAWEKSDTAAGPPLLARVAMLGDAHYAKATVGITGLHLQLDGEHHFRVLEAIVRPQQFAKGLMMVQVGMYFEQNHPGMYAAYKEHYAGGLKPPAKWAVKSKAGNMAWEMDLSLLQFEDAAFEPEKRSGEIDWKTSHRHQTNADGEAAENVGMFR